MKKKEKTLTTLGELNTQDIQARFQSRTWKRPDLKDLGVDVTKLDIQMGELEGEVTAAAEHIRKTRAEIAGFAGSERAQEIAEALAAKSIGDAEAYIAEQLDQTALVGTEPIPRRTAMLAYLTTMLSMDFHGDSDQAMQALRGLEHKGILVHDETGKGPIVIGIQHYVIPETWGFKDRHLKKVSESVAKFSRTFETLKAVRKTEQFKSMEEEAEIDLDEAASGKNGKCLLRVRGEPRTDASGNQLKDEVTKRDLYHPGGMLLVEFRGKHIVPLRASGGIENAVKEMVNLGVQIPKTALDDDKKLHMDKFLDDRRAFQLAWRFWKMVINGIEGHEAEKAQEAEKGVMLAKAEITVQEALGINGSSGQAVHDKIAFLEFRGAFKFGENEKRIYNPFFLVKLVDVAGSEHMEVVGIPRHLFVRMGEYVGKVFKTDDNFGHCPFGRLIRAIKGQATQDHTVQRGIEEISGNEESPENEVRVAAQ